MIHVNMEDLSRVTQHYRLAGLEDARRFANGGLGCRFYLDRLLDIWNCLCKRPASIIDEEKAELFVDGVNYGHGLFDLYCVWEEDGEEAAYNSDLGIMMMTPAGKSERQYINDIPSANV